MSNVKSDGERLLYECMVCHKYKPREQIINKGDIYFCRNCDDPVAPKEEPLSELPAIIVIPKLLLPSVESFNLFMDDILFYKSDMIPTFNDRTLTLTTTKTKKSIQINIDALLQILCDKYEHPTIKESYVKIIPIDIQTQIKNAYTDIQEKLEHAFLKYNKILCFEDKRIKDLCEDYAIMHEIPLNLKLDYMEFEKGLVSQYINREIAKGLHERDKQVSQIQQDYSSKLNEEKVKNNTKIENYKKEIQRLQGTVESLNVMIQSGKEKQNTLEIEKNEMYERFKNIQAENEGLKVDAGKLKREIEKLKKDAEKYKAGEEWVLDPISTDDEPIYFNQVTGEIVKYPENFKGGYKIQAVEEDILVYKEKDGDKEFKLPKSLMKFVATKAKIVETTNSTVPKEGIKGNLKLIFDAVGREWTDADEIFESSGFTDQTNHGYEYLKKLVEMGLIVEDKDEDEGIKNFKKA